MFKQKKDVVAGLGEIGKPILQLISRNTLALGYDLNKDLMNDKMFTKHTSARTRFLHVCIPFTDTFVSNVVQLYNKFKPQAIVIHSTIRPRTTEKIQKKLDVWVPHDLTVKNLMDRFSICESLLKRNDIEPFLKRLITGDEKWITYDNNVRKRSWTKRNEAPQTVAKPKLTPRKVMLSVWWDWKGIVH